MAKLVFMLSTVYLAAWSATASHFVEKQSADELCKICGIKNVISDKIINGTDAKVGEFPWRVALLVDWKEQNFYCSGTIINKNWVLTAAHCLPKTGSSYTVYMQAGSLEDYDRTHGQMLQADQTTVVLDTKYDSVTKDHDAALIQVPGPGFNFSIPNIAPICLPYRLEHMELTGEGIASGWGFIDNDESRTEVLKTVALDIYDRDACNNLLKERNSKHRATENQICTFSSDKGPCQGDSGGSLDKVVDNRSYQIGIVSAAVGPCGGVTFYAKAANFLGWIEEQTGANFCTK